MKFLLAAIGSKYIHCNLAVHSLRAYALAGGVESKVETAEYTINQNPEEILADLYHRRPDAVGFSCYIWNISLVQRLVADLHQLLPEVEIWLGGPEVSYDAYGYFQKLPFLTGIMVGEGEETFLRLMRYYDERERGPAEVQAPAADGPLEDPRMERKEKISLSAIPGIVWQDTEQKFTLHLHINPPNSPVDLSALPFVYEHMEGGTDHKIVYYESSRGCPFSCSYCLSSIDKKLRFRDPELVERELAYFLERKVPQVKFVDRTFNCSHAHAIRIWHYIKEHDNGVTNFHFEVSADLLDQEELELLCGMRPGLVQLEIGVQSVNPDTLREIRRTMDLDKLARNVTRLREAGNIHLHLDLIAGLPWEDYASFGRSFDWVYSLRPENLQLGFLKVLKGSHMQEMCGQYGLLYGSEPPYEVLQTRWISYEELCRLKQVEKVLEIYYNSGQFTHTMERLGQFYPSAFSLYEELAEYFAQHGLFDRQISRQERFSVLWDFLKSWPERRERARGQDCAEEIGSERSEDGGSFENIKFSGVAWNELLVYDYYLRENAKVRPAFAPDQKVWWPKITEWYARHAGTCPHLKAYQGYTYRQLLHTTHAEVLSRDFTQNGQKHLVLFDYQHRNPLTGNAFTWVAEEFSNEEEI